MAKGNMLQGMARGKVGDVVFSRLNGEQIARVRNRNPKNPKTNAQLYQRAIMATVMSAYSAGKVIFDHSFQGFSVGEANQRRFMSLNAKRLRGILANDLKAESDDNRSISSFCAPGVNSPAPALLQISEGKYPQRAFASLTNGMVEPNQGETVAQYAERVGLVEGDIYTIVGFIANTDQLLFEVRDHVASEGTYKPYIQYATNFYFIRLQVKAGLAGIDTAITAATTLSTLFDVTDSLNAKLSSTAKICDVDKNEWLNSILTGDGIFTAKSVAGVIRSRIDQDLRSTSYMTNVIDSEFYNPSDMQGISTMNLLNAWKQGAQQVGESDLILEGGDQ